MPVSGYLSTFPPYLGLKMPFFLEFAGFKVYCPNPLRVESSSYF
jgi:hypothetical protein